MERSLSFGSAAEDYERYRPGYDDRIADAVRLRLQPLAGPEAEPIAAIEIGAGTGKATRMMAPITTSIVAVEPDPAMLAVLARTCADLSGVRPLLGTFEDLDPATLGPFDLLYAAAAFHWTRPQGRWDRTAALVRPGGLVAFVAGPMEHADPDVAAVEQEESSAVLGQPAPAGPRSTGPMQWPGDELLADRRFADVEELTISQRLTLAREDYLGHLNTLSVYRMITDADRSRVFEALRRRLPDEVVLNADLVLHTARQVNDH